MNKTTANQDKTNHKPKELDQAINEFFKRGGKINSAPTKETLTTKPDIQVYSKPEIDTTEEQAKKAELLRALITKGAGMSALQYSLRMNKGDIKRMAQEHGLKITHSRPLCNTRKYRPPLIPSTSAPTDDVIAGHAMHYAALGYTAIEIAQTLELTVRQVWELGKNYRFELQQHREV